MVLTSERASSLLEIGLHRSVPLLVGLLVVLAPGAESARSADAGQSWVAQDLGVLPGKNSSGAVSVNAAGVVVGTSSSASYGEQRKTRGFVWRHGSMRDLGALHGWETRAVGVNDRLEVLAVSGKWPHIRSFVWKDGRIRDLGQIRGREITEADAINNRGQVVGTSESASAGIPHAFLWQDGRLHDLGPGVPAAINERGQVVGTIYTNGIPRAVLWQGSETIVLGTLGGRQSRAAAINAYGQVAGTSKTSTDHWHAFRWQNGRMTDLGTLGGSESEAAAINDRGGVVGRSYDSHGHWRAFISKNGHMHDLGDLGGASSNASSINDRGQVIGSSYPRQAGSLGFASPHGFVWQNGKIHDLVALPISGGQTITAASALNERNQIVGMSERYQTQIAHAVLWTLKQHS